MAYATAQDMIDRFGEKELVTLVPLRPSPVPAYDQTRVNQALADASVELDGYLAVRYAVPLAVVPGLVKRAVCDLAREALDSAGRQPVLEAGKRARAWIKDVAAGRATLGSGLDGDPDAVPVADSGGVEVDAPDRVFTDHTLAGYVS